MTRIPTDWRWLKRRISRVKVLSCADGTLRIAPTYKRGYAWSTEKGMRRSPGLATRLEIAHEIETKLNAKFKRPLRARGRGRSKHG